MSFSAPQLTYSNKKHQAADYAAKRARGYLITDVSGAIAYAAAHVADHRERSART